MSSRLGGLSFALFLIRLTIFKKLSLLLISRMEIRFRSARSLSNLPALGFNMSTCNDAIVKYKKFLEVTGSVPWHYRQRSGLCEVRELELLQFAWPKLFYLV